jgi:hypothetical protein
MKAAFSYSAGLLIFLDDDGSLLRSVPAFSKVRNELNGQRSFSDPNDVEYSENSDGSQGTPTMPRPFPSGSWTISGIEATTEKWLQPYKLITNANQDLDVWALKPNGTYDKPTGEKIGDFGYRIHFANGSQHTDGCIGLYDVDDILWCKANLVFPIALEAGS